jgi:anaerobic selenocysteine-containing dehydrogenase
MSHPASSIVRTMCPMNCHPTLCGMRVEVRDGRLVGIDGDPDNPDSRGFLCIRGRASREIPDNPARVLRPLVRERRSDPFREASWDEVLDRIVASIAASPPEATAFWPGHGTFATNYGTRIAAQLMARFANLHGSQFLQPTMICWGLGAFGLGLTGLLETHTKEDLAENARMVVLWGANFASQPTTARYVARARERGAHVVAIDVRRTEAAAKADEAILVRPGSDTALALAAMHVICAEALHDADFVARHTVGFDDLAAHVRPFTPGWAEPITGVPAERIVAFARSYAATRPGTIVLGGSSMHKGANAWQAARAISCLPALVGNVGVPGGGLGTRHGGGPHGRGMASVAAADRRAPGAPTLPSQMSAFSDALRAGGVDTLLLMGTNMLTSYADSDAAAEGLARTRLVVSHDLFLNDTARRFADVVLPATAWLEELGCKMTDTHVYLMEPALPAAGEARSAARVLRDLAARVGLDGFWPWPSEEALLDAILDHPGTGRATVATLRARGGIGALQVSQVAHPALRFDTPSGRIELRSSRAEALGLPGLPTYDGPRAPGSPPPAAPLVLTFGRTLGHFHSFYDAGRALPTLAAREPHPRVWLAPSDAAARGIADGAPVRLSNAQGTFDAVAHVTDRMPAGAAWIRDGWDGLNRLTRGDSVLPDHAVQVFGFSAGQASFDARVDVAPV